MATTYQNNIQYNGIYDWLKLQGMSSAQDSSIQIRRDINTRYVTLENSGDKTVGIAITLFYCSNQTPKIQFYIQGGEIKHLGINTIDGPMQFIHIFDPQTNKPIGSPTSFRTDSNCFVIRMGDIGKYWIQSFKRAVYSAQH